MGSMDQIEEIRRGLAKPGKTNRGLARAIGKDPAAVTRLLDGTRALKAKEIAAARAYLELDDDAENAAAQKFTSIPIFPVDAPANIATLQKKQAAKGGMMFDLTWLNSLSVTPKDLFVLEVSGDAMWDTLHHGDHALVDPAQCDTRRDGLYVLRLQDQLQVKRVSMHPVKQTLTIKSDNAAYPAFDNIPPDQIDLVGRVVWIGRRL